MSNVRLLRAPWEDDFSAARNQALDAVQTDYVLLVEHNERIDLSTVSAALDLVGQEDLKDTIHCVRIDVLDAEGQVIESTYEPRLWRSRPEVRYRGRVYETLCAPDDARYAFHDTLRLLQLYTHQTEIERAEIQLRNDTLLAQQEREDPDDPHTLYCVALTYLLSGEYTQALDYFESIIQVGIDDDRTRSAQLFAVECLRRLERPKEGFERGLEWVQQCPDYGELWFFIGRAALEAGLRVRAEAAFKFARRVPELATPNLYRDPTVAAYRAEVGQAQALVTLRESEAAQAILTNLRGRMPPGEQRDLDDDFVQIWLQLNEPYRAWAIIESWMSEAPAWAAKALVSVAEYVFNAQGPQEAYNFFQRAIAAHECLIEQLPVELVGAAFAELAKDTDSQLELLKLCVELGSQNSEHYRLLARLLVERGDLEAAKEINQLLRALPRTDDSA